MDVKRKKSGFTIVELLTVLAIITMLVGLLVPALNLVKNIAKETKQRAQLTTIGLALSAFRNEDDFGDYPPSSWVTPPAEPGDYCGAQKLAEALLGWDLVGVHPDTHWQADGKNNKPYMTGGVLYAPDQYFFYDTTNPIEMDKRISPYLELATANAFRLGVNPNRPDPEGLFDNPLPLAPLNGDTFVICDVFGVKKINITQPGPPVTVYKSFMAGTPILYYRANTSGKTVREIYNVRDNVPLTTQLKSIADGKDHPLGNFARGYEFFYGNPATGVIGYIQDPKITASPRPYRPDSYLLISAGLDGLYGTEDDIRNFGK
jgi:prepilin-type N-terminal cleavage/methylation domain-containing protein